jgi:hypothetical protein
MFVVLSRELATSWLLMQGILQRVCEKLMCVGEGLGLTVNGVKYNFEILPILRSIQRHIIINVHRSLYKVLVILARF